MPGSFVGFNTALRGLRAQQRGMYTTSHNIANANTEGYTRQRVVMTTTPAYPIPSINHPGGSGWQVGTGVVSQEILRVRDEFLDSQIRRETGTQGKWEQIEDVLKQIEVVFKEPSETGLSTLLSQFWASWQEFAKNADSVPVRTTLAETANSLAEAFNHSYNQLKTIQNDIDQVIELKVKEANSLIRQIADLNEQIYNIAATGDHPNDLMDQRDLLLDKLSKIIDFNVKVNPINMNGEEFSEGRITITVQDSDGNIIDLTAVDADNNLINSLSVDNTDKSKVVLNGVEVKFNNGEIKGLQEVRNNNLDSYINNLNDLAKYLATNINEIHKEGYDLYGNKAGEDFFLGVDAGNLRINPEIYKDPSKIAGAKSPSRGDGSNALEIAQLQNKAISDLQEATFDDYYKNFTASLGVAAHEAECMVVNQTALVDQLINRKESISGVSLDEEMSNMLLYQRAYEASARMITTLDSMLDKIINGMGVVR